MSGFVCNYCFSDVFRSQSRERRQDREESHPSIKKQDEEDGSTGEKPGEEATETKAQKRQVRDRTLINNNNNNAHTSCSTCAVSCSDSFCHSSIKHLLVGS